MQVFRDASGWEVHRIGFRIVDQGMDIQWRQEPRWTKGLPEGERIFIRHHATSTIVGPWRVGRELPDMPRGRELLPHPNPSKVFEYAIKSLEFDSIYDDAMPLHAPRIELLLYPPDETTGQLVDLATQKQLAKWVVERMVAAAPQAVARFDKETPGWRTKLRDELEGYSEPERHVYRSRWERLEGALNDLVFESESAEKLLRHPKFLDRFEVLVKSQIDGRVATRVGEIEQEAKRKAKGTVELVEKEISDLTRQLQEAKDRRDEVSRDLQTKLDALREREEAVNELVSHLAESRERMLRDIAVYQSLLPGTTPPAAGLSTEPKPTPKVAPSGPAITDAAGYIDSRLWPSLDRWHRGIPRAMSVILHAAVCGSRAVIVPTPAWARAYADSLGAQAKLTVVNVQPTWLGFDDLWRGGLGCCWERAARDTAAVELVLLRDFNRAFPQCYARPLLDMIAGYADCLPDPGSGCWPKNLRLIVCPSPPDESLPLTAEVVRHFAAVQRTPAAAGNDRARPAVTGHVPSDTWLAWGQPGQPADPDAELCKDFGPLACVAAAETASVAQVLRTFGMSEREANRTAREIRVTEPAEYLLQSPPESGVAR